MNIPIFHIVWQRSQRVPRLVKSLLKTPWYDTRHTWNTEKACPFMINYLKYEKHPENNWELSKCPEASIDGISG